MAYIPKPYPRRHEKNKDKGTYCCKVKMPDKSYFPISIGVPWPGNVREANSKAVQLQEEVNRGRLDGCLEWLGPQAAQTLMLKLGIKAVENDPVLAGPIGVPTDWKTARLAWLQARHAKPTVERKINQVDRTKKDYEIRTTKFVKWTEANGIKWKARTATSLLVEFARHRAGIVQAGTVLHDMNVLFTWFGWLHRRGYYDLVDKTRVKEEIPPLKPIDNWVPDWAFDVKALEAFHQHRFDSESIFASWRLFVLIRGLGCRPTEAIHLSWDTVDLQGMTVTFRDTKDKTLSGRRVRDRQLPIIFKWTLAALTEMKALGAKRGTAVAINTEGNFWKGDGQSANSWGRAISTLGISNRMGFTMKACQRASLAHLEDVGFPMHVVAEIAGHSLPVHQERYSRGGSLVVLPLNDRSYGKWDALTPAGLALFDRHFKIPHAVLLARQAAGA